MLRMDFIESHAVGRCEGYKAGTVFHLAGGSAYVQVDDRHEYLLRDRPRARVWQDSTGACMLDLEGTSGVVRVERWAAGGAGGVLKRLDARRHAHHKSSRAVDRAVHLPDN